MSLDSGVCEAQGPMGNALIMTVRAKTDALLTAGRSESVAGVITPANNATCSLRLALLLSARLYMTSSGDYDTHLAASVHGKAAVCGHGLWRVQNSSDETKTAVDNAKKAAAGF